MRTAIILTAWLITAVAFGQSRWTFIGDTTLTWEQAIDGYLELDRQHSAASLITIGNDDDGSPIHLFVIADGSGFSPDSIRATGKNILWITNGIHPGEPDGIDASLMLAQALLEDDRIMGLTAQTVVCIVPMYNVWGAKQRQRLSRPDQNGPVEHGIRANAKNLDLNRDFIKMDAQNTWALVKALAQWDPDVYFETHVSDGADHQYVMELLTTQKDKLDSALSTFMTGTVVPELYQWMDDSGILMCPYFETMKEIPEDGLIGFNDGPRYSTGYNALFDRIGILAESHMLKPYADRVNATFQLMLAILTVMDRHSAALGAARTAARERTAEAPQFGFNWQLDSPFQMIPWRGYKAVVEKSALTGLDRLRYDHDFPTNDSVPWYDRYLSSIAPWKPHAYLVPRQWTDVIERLEANGVELDRIDSAQVIRCEGYDLASYDTPNKPYEGRYPHRNLLAKQVIRDHAAIPGDVLVPMGHTTDRFVMSVLEPETNDSYFSWNFFDAVLQQKEWFTPYAFDSIAAAILEKDPELRARFEELRKAPEFAIDQWAQYNFILQQSPWAEGMFPRYPVLRVVR